MATAALANDFRRCCHFTQRILAEREKLLWDNKHVGKCGHLWASRAQLQNNNSSDFF